MGTREISLSSDPEIGSLINGLLPENFNIGENTVTVWELEGIGPNQITFSFPTSGAYYILDLNYVFAAVPIFGDPEIALEIPVVTVLANPFAFDEYTAEQNAAVQAIANNFNSFAGAVMVEESETFISGATIRYANTGVISNAFSPPPGLLDGPMAGDVWMSNDFIGIDYTRGGFGYWLNMHETGHALGLKHGHEEGLLGDADEGFWGELFARILDPIQGDDWGDPLPAAFDSPGYTVMTYRDYEGGPAGNDGSVDKPQSYMRLDIAAFQHLYGANYDHNSGDTTYSWNNQTGERYINYANGNGAARSGKIFETIWDGGGNDTYDFSNYSTNLQIDLRPGNTVDLNRQNADLGPSDASFNIANAYLYQGNEASLIENATGGSGRDIIIGNQAGNRLVGNAGQDQLEGLDGNDVLRGGAGADFLYAGAGNDTASYTDSNAAVTIDLAAGTGRGGHAEGDVLTEVENVEGSGFADTITGTGVSQRLSGFDGDDFLFGGGGGDEIDGGVGTDTAGYAANRSAYSYTFAGGIVSGVQGAGETYALSSIELLQFADRTVRTDGVSIIGGDTSGATLEDNLLADEGVLTVSDLFEADEYFQAATLAGQYGTFELDRDGYWTYTSRNASPEVQALQTGQTLSESFIVRSADGTEQAIVTTLSGTNEATTGPRQEVIDGTSSADLIDTVRRGGRDVVNAGSGNDTVNTGAGDDLVQSGRGNDTIDGGSGNDTLRGDAGTDWLLGGTGDDLVDGGRGNDVIDGGNGVDRIIGGLGNDTMTGGLQSDTFLFTTGFGQDVITDFQLGVGQRDLIDISGTGITAATFAASVGFSTSGGDTLVTIGADSLLLQRVGSIGVDYFQLA